MRDAADLWAKSTGETVACHTLKVLENLRQLRERCPYLGQLCVLPDFWALAALSVCLHDLGKCCEGFQDLVHRGTAFRQRHEVLSAVFTRWILRERDSEQAPWVAAAILTHHKDWREITTYYPAGDLFAEVPDGLDVLSSQMSQQFFQFAERIVRDEVWPLLAQTWAVPCGWSQAVSAEWIPKHPVKELRGVVEMTRCLIRQLNRLTLPAPQLIAGTLLRGALILSDHSGSAWEEFRVLLDLKDVERMRARLGLLSGEELYEHQRAAAAHVGNTVLTAPTGSGKTEAALLWASRQSAAVDGHPLLYYLLPYQASLNAMRKRLAEKFDDSAVTLQHSHALQALYRQLLDKQYAPSDAQRTAKREKNLASLYVKPLRISTPYQLLKGAFQLKGHEALWTASASALFILDEIHAYEVDRMAIILATIGYLCRDLGGKALIMSATMPGYLKTVLAETLPGVAEIRADEVTLEKFCRHQVRLLHAELMDDSVLESISADVRNGMAVLVVATSVGRAQEMRHRLLAQGHSDVELLHGRFHADDRARKESALLATYGTGARCATEGVILVATQVVEVSLNVDFDVLYSDPAPLEALLQRFGRVNRSRPPRAPTRIVNVCRGVPDGCPVYPENLVTKALAALESWDGKHLHEDNVQTMLDGIYDEKLGGHLTKKLLRTIETFSTQVLASCRPFGSDAKIEGLFDQLFDGYEVLPASLEHEYRRRMEEQPLLAPGLLIPITGRQYFSLRGRGRLRRMGWVDVADCPYTEQGLELYGPRSDDGV